MKQSHLLRQQFSLFLAIKSNEVRNSRVGKSSYEIKLIKMALLFELLTRNDLWKFFFQVANLTS